MKTTFLVRDGLCQVVLHPETPVERAVLDLVQRGQSVEVHRAQFAETRGGYVRQFGLGGHSLVGSDHLPDLVLVLRPAETADAPDVLQPFGGGRPAHTYYSQDVEGEVFVHDTPTTFRVALPSERARLAGASSAPADADLCKLRDGTWVYRNHAGTWQTCPSPFPPDQTYEVQQLRGEMAAILEHCTKETGFDASTKLKAIKSLVETALGRDTTHVGGGHD